MNKEYVDEFIKELEKRSKVCDSDKYVNDKAGAYLESAVLEDLILEAKELIQYGELEVALENILENLHELSISLDTKIIDLARRAFGKKVRTEIEQLLDVLTRGR